MRQILNLDPTFLPFGEGSVADVSGPYPSGVEANIDLRGIEKGKPALIVSRFGKSVDVMKLLLATDALRRANVEDIQLFIPFLLYARQDRVEPEWEGQAFSLKVFADLLNTQKYSGVKIFDPHSTVATALIHNSEGVRNHGFLQKIFAGKTGYLLVSPDAGMAKKIREVAKVIGYEKKPVQVLKYRLLDGSIDEIEIHENDFGGQDLYIVDDICDGGATFTSLAGELRKRNAGKITLIISHGIFSRGVEAVLSAGVDEIITTDSFQNQVTHPKLTEVKLCNILT